MITRACLATSDSNPVAQTDKPLALTPRVHHSNLRTKTTEVPYIGPFLPCLTAEALVEALHALPRLSAHASRPAAAPANPAPPLGSTQAPRAPRTVPPSLAICDCHRSLQRCSSPPRRGRPSRSFGPLAPRSDAPRTTRLRTPRRDPGWGGRQHLQPATLTMPSQLIPLTTLSLPFPPCASCTPADGLRDA